MLKLISSSGFVKPNTEAESKLSWRQTEHLVGEVKFSYSSCCLGSVWPLAPLAALLYFCLLRGFLGIEFIFILSLVSALYSGLKSHLSYIFPTLSWRNEREKEYGILKLCLEYSIDYTGVQLRESETVESQMLWVCRRIVINWILSTLFRVIFPSIYVSGMEIISSLFLNVFVFLSATRNGKK